MRVGLGEDLHRIDDARTLVLGGVIIEEGPGLSGHRDADVLLHAITDAVSAPPRSATSGTTSHRATLATPTPTAPTSCARLSNWRANRAGRS